jgi:hypothetical protein
MTRALPLALAAALCVSLLGCPNGGSPRRDAGEEDAGELDAGHDAGTVDPVDGGEADAGVPPELAILKVLPPRGPATGGISVLLQGSGFVRGVANRATEAKKRTTLKFGSNVAQDFQVIDDGTIDVRLPPGKAGLAHVTIENDNGLFVCSACFTYYDELVLSQVSPKEGPLRGGTVVTLGGQGFTSDVEVLFGAYRAPEVTVVSATELRAVAPRGAAEGLVDVVVFSKNGVGSQRRVFRYVADLRIGDITPPTGPVAGGTPVTLTGQGLEGATQVLFGDQPAQSFTVDGPTQLTAVTPAGASLGAVAVTVQTPRDAWTVRDGFTYAQAGGPFALYGLFPHVAASDGSTVVTITGQGLDDPGLELRFGGALGTVVAQQDTWAQVLVPARGASARKVDVSAQVGTDAPKVLEEGLTYRLSLAAIAPDRGPVAGGQAAVVSGEGLPSDAESFLGALAAQTLSATETQLSLLTPKGQGGPPTDLWVREQADPENEAVLPGAYTFEEALLVGRVQPDRGAIAGGTLVTVLGTGFGEGTVVSFGTLKAKDVKVVDAHRLTCRTPRAGAVGSVMVTVERAGQRDELPGGFSYFDPRSISGGLSGGPLAGTLNVTVLDSTEGAYGAPVPLATVVLGADPFTPFQGPTDSRGQITFSDPTMVKAQTVTAFKEGYETVTVTAVASENLTVYIARTGGDGEPSPPPPGPPPSTISGRVTGFKAPRPLGEGESLEARVFVSQRSLFAGPPYRGPPSRGQEKWQVVKDGGEYVVLTRSGLWATYAVLGVANRFTNTFEPYLMGIRRGITVSPDFPATGQDIALNMHLGLTVPITIDGPLMAGGFFPAANELFGWIDLGAEGFIPNPNNWGTGTSAASAIRSTATSFSFPHFPFLDGSNFLFLNLAGNGGYPESFFFRRQPGDLSKGLTIGPMLQGSTVLEPNGTFTGTISWVTDPGPTPDIHQVEIIKQTMGGTVTVWSMVLPGTESQVTLPPAAVQKLTDEEQGEILYVVLVSSRSAKFSYNQWTYDSLSLISWSSYVVSLLAAFSP